MQMGINGFSGLFFRVMCFFIYVCVSVYAYIRSMVEGCMRVECASNFFSDRMRPSMDRGYGADVPPSARHRSAIGRYRLDSGPLWDQSRTLLTLPNPVVAAISCYRCAYLYRSTYSPNASSNTCTACS